MWIQLIHLLNTVTAPINTYLINFYYTRYHRTWQKISYVFLIPMSYTIFSVCLSAFPFPTFLLHEIFLFIWQTVCDKTRAPLLGDQSNTNSNASSSGEHKKFNSF